MLRELIHRIAGRRVVVCGDVMLDEYVFGVVSRISPEAPVPVVEADLARHRHIPGGAANVACNLRALGAEVALVGVIGDDEAGAVLRRLMEDAGVDTSGLIVEPGRPTTVKTRIIAHHQQVVRVDREVREPPEPNTLQAAKAAVERFVTGGAHAVALSDYDKGLYRYGLAEAAVEMCRRAEVPCVANGKPPNLGRFTGATAVSMNLHEAELAVGRRLADRNAVLEAALELRRALRLAGVVVTMGGEGLVLAHGDAETMSIPAVPVEVFDVVGAGDAVLSATTLALAAGATLPEAAQLANVAGGAVVRKLGTATVTREELLALL